MVKKYESEEGAGHDWRTQTAMEKESEMVMVEGNVTELLVPGKYKLGKTLNRHRSPDRSVLPDVGDSATFMPGENGSPKVNPSSGTKSVGDRAVVQDTVEEVANTVLVPTA